MALLPLCLLLILFSAPLNAQQRKVCPSSCGGCSSGGSILLNDWCYICRSNQSSINACSSSTVILPLGLQPCGCIDANSTCLSCASINGSSNLSPTDPPTPSPTPSKSNWRKWLSFLALLFLVPLIYLAGWILDCFFDCCGRKKQKIQDEEASYNIMG